MEWTLAVVKECRERWTRPRHFLYPRLLLLHCLDNLGVYLRFPLAKLVLSTSEKYMQAANLPESPKRVGQQRIACDGAVYEGNS